MEGETKTGRQNLLKLVDHAREEVALASGWGPDHRKDMARQVEKLGRQARLAVWASHVGAAQPHAIDGATHRVERGWKKPQRKLVPEVGIAETWMFGDPHHVAAVEVLPAVRTGELAADGVDLNLLVCG